jgi:hypothetical protein
MPYKDPKKRVEACEKTYRESAYGNKHDYMRNTGLRRNYGITLDDFNALAKEQNFACVICGKVPSEDLDAKWNQKVLHVDHDHLTGKIRGLLCSDCNRGIGFLGESAERLERAALYLRG